MITVFVNLDGDNLMLGMRAKTSGWLAIGIDPEDKMKNSDILMGFVKDGKATVIDSFAPGTTGPHPADETQGGKHDVTLVSGSIKDGVTVIEFMRKLNTGDSKDKVLKRGENKVIWAIHDGGDPKARHHRRGYGTLSLQ